MHNEAVREIKSCIPICVILHMGITVCIWGSPNANRRGSLKSSHMGIPLRIMKLCAYGVLDYIAYSGEYTGALVLVPRI
jgi:hypothetical protein